jgi:hypothetical protein
VTTPAPQDGGAPRPEWWTRPVVVLPIVCSIVLLVALLTPQEASGRFGDSRLTTHLPSALGARVLNDMASRSGWHTARDDSIGAPAAGDGRTIHAVLAPVTPVTATQAHRYLEAVRAGDGLLLVLSARSALTDSLGVAHYARGGLLPVPRNAGGECQSYKEMTPPLWADGRVHLFGIRWLRNAPSEKVGFATLNQDEFGMPAPSDGAAGFPLGLGRVVVVADPDLLRTDVLRHCEWGADVIAMAMLEWLRAGGTTPRTVLVFDEYHQGFGPRSDMMSTAMEFLITHPVGRTIAMALLASLVLLIAVAPRALPPVDTERIERRDPREQVDALAHAYEQVRATRTITARLLHGVRRRAERTGGRTGRSDSVFLDDVARRAPQVKGDIEIVRHALGATVSDRALPDVGAALSRIEHTLTTSDT